MLSFDSFSIGCHPISTQADTQASTGWTRFDGPNYTPDYTLRFQRCVEVTVDFCVMRLRYLDWIFKFLENQIIIFALSCKTAEFLLLGVFVWTRNFFMKFYWSNLGSAGLSALQPDLSQTQGLIDTCLNAFFFLRLWSMIYVLIVQFLQC